MEYNRDNYRNQYRNWEKSREAISDQNRQSSEDYKSRLENDPRMISYRGTIAKYDASCVKLRLAYTEASQVWEDEKYEFTSRLYADKLKLTELNTEASVGEDVPAADLGRIVVHFSPFPFRFPRFCNLVCRSSEGLLLLELIVPSSNNIVFVDHKLARGETKETTLSVKQQQYWYDYLVYSMLVKAIFDIAFEKHLELYQTIAANVITRYKSPKTGFDAEATIASVVVPRTEARSIDPSHINPIETFRGWKGVAAKALSELIPVQPTVIFDKNDSRLIHGRDVLSEMSDTQNLAIMDWDDFEHLVRQLFEMEFKSTGADVRITRSSRDCGVDAIVFDPDPIRGGKIIIQAKRYTNTVDVSSVRDLFRTVQNEGANRGILVTTSHYGADSFEFARGKPITLIDGPQLLALLQKHGFQFRLDISEARQSRA